MLSTNVGPSDRSTRRGNISKTSLMTPAYPFGIRTYTGDLPAQPGRPDLLLSTEVLQCRTWVKVEHTPDHFTLLIIYGLASDFYAPPHDRRLRLQFERADWLGFQRNVDRNLNPALARRLRKIRDVKIQRET